MPHRNCSPTPTSLNLEAHLQLVSINDLNTTEILLISRSSLLIIYRYITGITNIIMDSTSSTNLLGKLNSFHLSHQRANIIR